MTLAQQIASDQTAVFLRSDDFAETVSYTPSGGSAKDIKAVISARKIETNEEGKIRQVEELQVYISSDATAGVATPTFGDTFTRNSKTYELVPESEIRTDPGGHTMMCQERQVIRRAQSGLRRPR